MMFTKTDRDLLIGLNDFLKKENEELNNRFEKFEAITQNLQNRLSVLESAQTVISEKLNDLKQDVQKNSQLTDTAEQEIRTMLLYTVMEEIPDDAKSAKKEKK